MNALFRRAEQRNVRGGRLLPLTVVLLSVLAFVVSTLLIASGPTYADSIHAVESGETDEVGGQSSLIGEPVKNSEALESMESLSGSGAPEATKEEAVVTEGAGEASEGVPSVESAASPESYDEKPKPRSRFRRAAAVNAASCANGDLFYSTHHGEIFRLDDRGERQRVAVVPRYDHAPYLKIWEDHVNALGVGRDARYIYVVRQWQTLEHGPGGELLSSPWSMVVYELDTRANGQWRMVSEPLSENVRRAFIAGAVQLNTGDYYMGYFDTNYRDGRLFFNLMKYSRSRDTFIQMGDFFTGKTSNNPSRIGNGDMAFDEEGNLFILQSTNTEATIFTISADELRDEADRPRRVTSPGTVRVANGESYGPGGQLLNTAANGIAFDSRGRLFLSTAQEVTMHDPLDFQKLGTRNQRNLGEGGDFGTDLATCESPATIRVFKNVNDRVAEDDQFQLNLSLLKNGRVAKEVLPVSTSGNARGLQKESVGVFPARTGSVFSFSEAMTNESRGRLSDYNASWACTADGRPLGSGNGGNAQISIPNIPSVKVKCTITNTPLSGSLVWEKVDGDDRNMRLKGSAWTLSGPLAQGRSGTVTDCVAADASQCRAADNDTDPRAGYFKVDGLYLGRYTLREQTPPSGYEATTQTFTQELTADGQQLSFGQIGNKKLVAQIQVKKKVLDPEGAQVPDASGWTLAVDLETSTTGTLSPLADTNSKWFGKHQVSDASGIVPEKWTISFPNSGSRQNIRVTEGAKADNYEASIECTSNKRASVKGTGTGLNVNDVQPGESLTCVVTNKQKPGSVAWEKTDPSGAHLSGSEWQLRMPGKGTVTVKDCVKARACQGLHDSDPQPGRFRVDGLKWGAGSLTELTSPPGYRRDGTTRAFTIREGALQANVGRITNEPVEVPPLPFTGGMSADSFLIAGSGALAIAFVFALMRGVQQSNGARVSTRLVHRRVKEEG